MCVRRLAGFILSMALALVSRVEAQPPIRIGEINSYTGVAAGFTLSYRQAVEMAVEEVNASGGLGGRRVEVLFRDDKGNPADAIKHAQELVFSERVALLAGTFLSNVGLAVSDFARQNKVLFVAAEPLTEAITWSEGHRYTFRVRPNTHSQGRMLAERASPLPHKRWAVIGPNYEYGRRAWETFWPRLKELKPDVQLVGEHTGRRSARSSLEATSQPSWASIQTPSTFLSSAATGSPSPARRANGVCSRRPSSSGSCWGSRSTWIH